MNLGIVTPRLFGYGGSEIYLLECLRRWQQRLDVTVYTPTFNPRLFEEFGIDSRVKVVVLSSRPSPGGGFDLLHESVVMPRLWESEIGRHDVHFKYLFPTQMIRRSPSVWFAAEPFRPLYDLRHHTNLKNKEVLVHFYPRLDYERIRYSDLDVQLHVLENLDVKPEFDRLATNSVATARYLESVYGRRADLVAYPGINPRGETPPPSSFDTVLHVGRMWRHKRIDLVLKAMARLDTPAKLLLAGDGPERPRLRRFAKRLGLDGRVRFLGDVTIEERDRLLEESLCCIYAPVREPFGMVPLEAAAAGRPVVATLGGGYSEVLTGKAAHLVPADPDKLAEAVQDLFDDPQRALAMGRAGREIAERYPWDRTADTLLELFRETAETFSSTNGNGSVPTRATRVARRPPPALGAHYYPWYRTGRTVAHWNEDPEFAGVTDFPVGGPYSSRHRAVMRRHLSFAREAGLDFLVVHWHVRHDGPSPYELEVTRRLFEESEKTPNPVRIAILAVFNTEDPDVMRDTIRRIKSDFVPRPVYHRWRRRPIVWYFLNDPFLGFLYHHYRQLVRLNRGIHPVATGAFAYNRFLPRHLRDFFDGWCLYSPLEAASARRRVGIWRESYRDFEEDGGSLRTFTICPGYDDSHLESYEREGNPHRTVPRAELRTYEQMQRAALDLDPTPDLVVVTSFNEFHENTHIEPSDRYGDTYLKATRAFKERLIASALAAKAVR